MSHSKRNTSRPVFTNHERSLAKSAWTSSSARLTRESFLPFASCSLCLESARDPVACPHGDIFCRECALSNILAQKKEVKRLEKARDQQEKDQTEEQDRKDAEAKQRAIKEFELTQQGLAVKASAVEDPKEIEPLGGEQPGVEAGGNSKKRKFELDDEELLRIAEQDRARARRALDEEKVAKPTLPSFWVPTLTPASNTKDTLHEVKKKPKTHPLCPASLEDAPHNYSLHELVTIHFTEESNTAADKTQRVCPACRKGLSNASKAVMAKPCGHVLCKNCVTKFMTPSGKLDPHNPDADPHLVLCYVCDGDVTERKGKDKIRPGLVSLRSEGTGFSAGGGNKVKRQGVGFQC